MYIGAVRRNLWIGLVVLLTLSACSRMTSASSPSTPTVQVTATETVASDLLLSEESVPELWTREFKTDFSRHTVPFDEILSGGPPKDGIPAVDEPVFVGVGAAESWLDDQEPVAVVRVDDSVRAYPIQIVMWHEIVNDMVGDVPIVVTFCPLCNTAIAFERTIDDLVMDFGTTGRLRYSNLIMYDRQTETWWQQATGEAIAGQFAGRQLTFLPVSLISWSDFRDSYPQGLVLSRETGFPRSYGRNPYTGYDNINNSPFLYGGPMTPGELPAMARVFTVDLNGETVAYPYATMMEHPVVNDFVGGEPVVVLWQPGVASALDRSVLADGRDVGTVEVFSRRSNGEILEFEGDGNRIADKTTGTVWNLFGQGISGQMAGSQLEPVVGVNHFWFSWAAFKPETRVYQATPEATGGPSGLISDEAPVTTPETEPAQTNVAVDALEQDFEILVYQGADVLGGQKVMFSEVLAQGKPVLVEFWAGLCPVCRRSLPELQSAHQEYGDQVIFLGLDIGAYTGLGDKEDAWALMAELGLSFATSTIPDSGVMQSYRVTGMPSTLYFLPDGSLFDRGPGLVGREELRAAIEALIAASGS